MCRLIPLVLGGFLVLPGFAQSADYDSLFTIKGYQQNSALNIILASLHGKPAELKKVFDLVRLKGNASDKCQVELAAELATIPDSVFDHEKAIDITEKYLAIAKKLGDHFLQACFYHIISEDYSGLGLHNKSFEYKLYCLDELNKDPSGHYFKQSWFLHQIASEYYRFRDYQKTVELCKAAFQLNGENSPNRDWFMKVISNLTGVSYLKNGMYDSAKVWLQKTYDLAIQQNDSSWTGISIGNTGTIYYMQKKYADAIPYYQKGLSLCRRAELWDNVAPFSCFLADCWMQTNNNTDSAAILLAEAKQANAKEYNLPNLIKYFSVAGEYYRRTGNTIMALQCADSLTKYENQQTEEYNINKKIRAEAQLAYHNKELENEIDRQIIKRNEWLLYSLEIMLTLLIVIGILLYKRQRLRYKFIQQKLKHEKYKTQEELNLAMTEIRDFTHLMQEKNELIQQFIEEIQNLKKRNLSITEDQLIHIEQLKQSAILTEDDWNNFKELFKKVHPEFLRNLKKKYPDLTPAETRYLVFTKLELNSKKMSAMLGVSAEAIRNIRFRIRKKLGPGDSDDIERLVNEC